MSLDQSQLLAKSYFESGLAQLEANDFLNAELNFKQANSLFPNRSSILINYSATLIGLEKWTEGEMICGQLLAIDPDNLEANINIGICLVHKNLPETAIKYFDKALALNSSYLPALINKANALQDIFNPEEALLYYQKALLLSPKSEEVLIGIGNIQIHFKLYDLALQSLNTALEINPNNPQALCNKGMLLIRLGQYSEGWKLYESRWNIPGGLKNYPKLKIPACTNVNQLNNRTIAVFAEQGFGDSIQFCRFLFSLLECCVNVKILFLAPQSLTSLLSSLHANIKILANDQSSIEYINNCADYFLPLLSLPSILNISNSSIQVSTPYLHPSRNKQLTWNAQVNVGNTSAHPFRVGISWSGSGRYASQLNTRRDLPFDEVQRLLSAFDNHNLQFHCLHKEFRNGELELLKHNHNVYLHSHHLKTFEDTAALMCTMDLIISIDTSIAHLAGALNLRHLLLLPDPPDFLSPMTGDTTPWYPSTKIIRQTKPNHWDLVIQECIDFITGELNNS